jgi:hypothetical protein
MPTIAQLRQGQQQQQPLPPQRQQQQPQQQQQLPPQQEEEQRDEDEGSGKHKLLPHRKHSPPRIHLEARTRLATGVLSPMSCSGLCHRHHQTWRTWLVNTIHGFT